MSIAEINLDGKEKHPLYQARLLEAALAYAARGWYVFPVVPGTRTSYLSQDHPDSGSKPWG